ncbi:golgi reassembly stacking protein 2 [Pseudohyphozyma bogoriensis]|nr:golgi reassembly stacking protein 2 [Pseudohyphozyma bogoriensis]
MKTGVAFHVLRVAELSPAAEAGIDPFFDFICGVNGHQLGDDIDAFTKVLEDSEDRAIVLQVWSTKRKELRDVEVVPSRDWSASGLPSSSGAQPSLLGLSLRICHPSHALEQVWHVLEILEGSPAQSAGLVPFGDWIVGYAGGVLRGEGDFYDVHVDKPLRLFVYNADYDVTREAILVPNRSWGGEGLLGCGVGYGLLHRIPKPQDRKIRVEESDEDVAGSSVVDSPLRGKVLRKASDGYEEAGYEQNGGEFEASEGVQVVPQGGYEDDGFVVPANHQEWGAVKPMSVDPAAAARESGGREYGAPIQWEQRRQSKFGDDVIEEEEEGMV